MAARRSRRGVRRAVSRLAGSTALVGLDGLQSTTMRAPGNAADSAAKCSRRPALVGRGPNGVGKSGSPDRRNHGSRRRGRSGGCGENCWTRAMAWDGRGRIIRRPRRSSAFGVGVDRAGEGSRSATDPHRRVLAPWRAVGRNGRPTKAGCRLSPTLPGGRQPDRRCRPTPRAPQSCPVRRPSRPAAPPGTPRHPARPRS